jgi:hypothetical protein
MQAAQGNTLAQSLREWLDANADKLDPDVKDLWMRLARELPSMKLPSLRGGMMGSGDVNLSTPPETAELSAWLDKLAAAAAQDAHELDQDLAGLTQLAGGRASAAGPIPGAPPDHAGMMTPAPGDMRENSNGGVTITPTAALVARAPAEYRELVSRYYERLARDGLVPAAPSPGESRPATPGEKRAP